MQDLLDVFWGPLYSRANITGTNSEPFNLGPTLNLTGSVTMVKDSLSVRGSGTTFTTELAAGDYIISATLDKEFFVQIARVIDNTTLTLTTKFQGNTFSGAAVGYTPTTLNFSTENGAEEIDISPVFLEDPAAATATEIVLAINAAAVNITSETVRDSFAQEILLRS